MHSALPAGLAATPPDAHAKRSNTRAALSTLTVCLAAATMLASTDTWASPPPGASFGAMVRAGSVTVGGAYQSTAVANHSDHDDDTRAGAYARVQGFAVGAMAWTTENPHLPTYCTVYTCSWRTSAVATVWETITITAPADAPEVAYDYDFSIDGITKRGPWAYGSGTVANARYYFGTDQNGWSGRPTVTLPSGTTVIQGRFTVPPGQSLTLYLMGELEVSARDGAVADFSHTLAFHWNLPATYTYTSASGRFSPTPVPEPGSLALMACGLASLGAWKRRQVRAQR